MQPGLSKSVKKAVVKNHLQGLDERENAKATSSSAPGSKLTPEEVDSVIKEFDDDTSKKGLEASAKEYGVSGIAKELSEIAHFKRENQLEFTSLLDGAHISSILKKFGTGTHEFEQFLSTVYARSVEKGLTPNEIISQSSKIEALEKKYNTNFEALKSDFDELGKSLAAKKKEKADLEIEVTGVSKKKKDSLSRFSLDEQKLQDYSTTKQQLSSFGFDVANLADLKNFLIAARNEKFDAKEIAEKLNELGDLQVQKTKIQQEIKGVKEEHDSKKKELDALEFVAKDRIKQLEERYSKQKAEIEAFSDLRAQGVDGKRILSWNQIMKVANVDYGTIEGELRNQGNLKNLEDKTSAKIKDLVSEEVRLGQSVAELKVEKEKIEASIQAIKESAVSGIEELRGKILSSLSSMKQQAESDLETTARESQKSLEEMRRDTEQQLKQVSETAVSNMKTTVGELKTSAESFSKELKDSLMEASPEIKNVGMALEAGEKIGKYRNIMPLLQLIDGTGAEDESEALIAMWNLSSRFNAWLENKYPGEKRDISEPLMRLLESINNEIQRVGGA